jgi:hypothetical protein
MNTETKDNKLVILRHLKEPPFVDPAPGVLQPLEQPTISEPFSVYPLVFCCSEIGKINETDVFPQPLRPYTSSSASSNPKSKIQFTASYPPRASASLKSKDSCPTVPLLSSSWQWT